MYKYIRIYLCNGSTLHLPSLRHRLPFHIRENILTRIRILQKKSRKCCDDEARM